MSRILDWIKRQNINAALAAAGREHNPVDHYDTLRLTPGPLSQRAIWYAEGLAAAHAAQRRRGPLGIRRRSA